MFGGRHNSRAKGRGKIREGREKRKESAGQMARIARKSRSMYSQHKNGTTTWVRGSQTLCQCVDCVPLSSDNFGMYHDPV